jgi:hypothetical protein
LLSVYSYIESGQNTCFTHLYEKTIAVFSFFLFSFFATISIFSIVVCVYSASASSASSNFLRSWSFLGAVGIAALVAGATGSASGVATLAGVATALAGVKSKRFAGVL